MRSLILRLAAFALVSACGSGDDGAFAQRDAAANGPDAAIDMTTALTATLNATRTLDNAGHGVNSDGTLHVEVHLGGFIGCPQMDSPRPSYTLILGRVPAASAATATAASASFVDYVGDMIDGIAPSSATAITLTNVTYVVGDFVALDATLTFPGGTVTGHLHAPHCPSLDD